MSQQSPREPWTGSKNSAASLKKMPVSTQEAPGGVHPVSISRRSIMRLITVSEKIRCSAAVRCLGPSPISIV
jgi:hypothetical protein